MKIQRIIAVEPPHIQVVLALCETLQDWFTPTGIEQIATDVKFQNLLIAGEVNSPIGFLTFYTQNAIGYIGWMGVHLQHQRLGVGSGLINLLAKILNRESVTQIQVKTLGEEDKYEPYVATRMFYRSMGFVDLSSELTANPNYPSELTLVLPSISVFLKERIHV